VVSAAHRDYAEGRPAVGCGRDPKELGIGGGSASSTDYHIITIPVKKYLEVIEGEEDTFWKLEA